MPEVSYTVQVERDLTEIGDIIARDNPSAAAAFIEAIRYHCSLLATLPLMGRARRDIDSAVRSFPHGRYIVFYRYRAELDRVEILRVWHGRRRMPTAADLS